MSDNKDENQIDLDESQPFYWWLGHPLPYVTERLEGTEE